VKSRADASRLVQAANGNGQQVAITHIEVYAAPILNGELVAELWERLGHGVICASCTLNAALGT
jgi:hypothetical protein